MQIASFQYNTMTDIAPKQLFITFIWYEGRLNGE